MTRKDYELIADCFADTAPRTDPQSIEAGTLAAILQERSYLANCIAAKLQVDNPRFDRSRFLAACGVQS